MDNLKLYKSSAGSGKTFTLVYEYLKIVLRNPEDFKSVLAVTFTNKAAAEMKERIITTLISLSNNEDTPMNKKLSAEFPKMKIEECAERTLKNILHDYSSFSICTIDSFFIRILRALSREMNLPINLELKLETEDAILDISDRLMREIGVDAELTDWMTKLAIQKLDEDKGWNIERDIESIGEEIFKEGIKNFKMLSRQEVHKLYESLVVIKKNFESAMKLFGEQFTKDIKKWDLDVSDFTQKSKGVAGYFEKLNNKTSDYKFGKFTMEALEDPEKWVSKTHERRKEVLEIVNRYLFDQLKKVDEYNTKELAKYNTANEILKKLYLFGVINDLQKKLTAYRSENNLLLISDTTQLLNDFVNDNDAPFLYEKTGNRFKHLLIDEFQDTSLQQWKNLLPLIINTLGSGFTTLVVGDAKQSIYRWRGGNMNLLLRDIFSDLKNFRSMFKEEFLTKNYRSRQEIVKFNNEFFKTAPDLLNKEVEMNNHPSLILAYDDRSAQEPKVNDGEGYVRIKFFESEKDEDDETVSWKDQSLIEMNAIIQDLLKLNYSYKDICILVNRNIEGSLVADSLFENNIKNIISPDSLLIEASPKINFLLNVMIYLLDNKNSIARTEILYYYSIYYLKNSTEIHELLSDHKQSAQKRKKKIQNGESLFQGLEDNFFNKILPEKFTAHLNYLGKLPVYELVEQLISIFSLNENPDAYIQRFQDYILDYSMKSDSSLEGFLNWWEHSGIANKASVIMPENTDAIRIMTIHASKGLQFPVVIMPFGVWSIFPKPNKIMWLKTNGSEYDEYGSLAVVSSEKLENSYFKESYMEEKYQTVIDNLNKLYVAFTRTEDRLYISCSKYKEVKDVNNTSKLIYKTCKSMQPGFDGYLFEAGNSSTIRKKDKNSNDSHEVYMHLYPSNRWQEKLSLTTHSSDLVALLEDQKRSKTNYGILVHRILAEINHPDEVNHSISSLVYQGLIHEDEKATLKNEINEIFSVPDIKKYFEGDSKVISEREIILPSGEVLRPDRVIIKNNKATVIDFKTGKRDKKHELQLKQYAEALRMMKYEEVSSKIIYLGEKETVEIN
jgi:ATP-dependent helicase/nuclease subunit A